MRRRSPKQHYTQLVSQLRTAVELPHGDGDHVFAAHGEGIVTRAMIESTLGQWGCGQAPSAMLVDLRDVAGYEAGSIRAAERWLAGARELGVRKIALLASSTVLRTAAQLASERSGVALQTFDDEESARTWLAGRGFETAVPIPVPQTNSEPIPVRL